MGVKDCEGGVVKLVHAGRYVETYEQPILAAEILKRNPRHSITRPDVFEYPWIVISPESVLKPGNVFFIVPNSTIYGLLKAHKENILLSSQCQSWSSKLHHADPHVQKQSSRPKPVMGNTPKQGNHNRWLKQSLPTASCVPMFSSKQRRQGKLACRNSHQEPEETSSTEGLSIRIMSSHHKVGSRKSLSKAQAVYLQDQDCDKNPRKQTIYESWPRLIPKNDNSQEEQGEAVTAGSFYPMYTNSSAEFPEKNHSDEEFKCSEEVRTLKPCLRKPDSKRMLLPLKVSFQLIEEVVEPHKRLKEAPTESAGNCSSFSEIFNSVPTYSTSQIQ